MPLENISGTNVLSSGSCANCGAGSEDATQVTATRTDQHLPTLEELPAYSPRTDERWLSNFLPPSRPKTTGSLVAGTEDGGKVWVKTADGYLLRFDNKDQRWKITGPDQRTTTIWGDPHVEESDGDKWDFTNRSTFVFGQNRVTVETVPSKSGLTYTGTVHIYSGNERFTLTDIDSDAVRFVAWEKDGKQHDAAHADGDVYVLRRDAKGKDEWAKQGK